ncbi:MAG: FHA domain-containing protein [Hyphomicrobiaceae bacterium]|nr:FHA domain-containing protein [Hyphomicrobiaceae bacterium]
MAPRQALQQRAWTAPGPIGAGAVAVAGAAMLLAYETNVPVPLVAALSTFLGDGLILARATEALRWVLTVAEASYVRQPAATVALAGVGVVPVIAIAASLGRCIASAVRMRRDHEALAAAPDEDGARASSAWIELDRGGARSIALGELARIGRSDDCDVALGDSGLAETHALIQRRSECEFFIIDVSANEGCGIAVNGHLVESGRLADGDRIELGDCRLVFRQPAVGWKRQGAAATA